MRGARAGAFLLEFLQSAGLRPFEIALTSGERIRLYVLDAGPSLQQSFHVIGAIFDKVYVENNPANELDGIQTWDLPVSGGAAYELVIPDAGLYPFVTHAFSSAMIGAIGVIRITT